MSKIYCADSRCKYYKNQQCMAKEVIMNSCSIMTMNEGRRDFLECKTFEKSDDYKRIEEFFNKLPHRKNIISQIAAILGKNGYEVNEDYITSLLEKESKDV